MPQSLTLQVFSITAQVIAIHWMLKILDEHSLLVDIPHVPTFLGRIILQGPKVMYLDYIPNT